jgi:dTDP-glucose pyrophosphorylase/predicted transcriptional regulator
VRSCKEIMIKGSTSILGAIQVIDRSTLQIALVVDEEQRLVGTVTDGDIRRAILQGTSLDEPVRIIMNPNPTFAHLNDGRDQILSVMQLKRLHQIPVIDDDRRVVGIEIVDQMLDQLRENWVVLMAGGFGSRLRPLTDDCPKPLLKVGGKPILETILENFKENGFYRFYLSVNYKAEMIQDFFADGSKWGVQIEYLYESKRMGTAGALGLLPEKPDLPIFIMNGDLLTKINSRQLLDYHLQYKADATMCVKEYKFQVPYGVVRLEKNRLAGIEEKPNQRFLINAGIYVLEPRALELVPNNEYLDMPVLFKKMLEHKRKIATFPIREYWLDIGQSEDYEKANGEYQSYFSDKQLTDNKISEE